MNNGQTEKPKVLVVGYLPPPFEGTVRITQLIINSEELGESFDIKFCSLSKRKYASLKGKFSLVNVVDALLNTVKYLLCIFKHRPVVVHFPLAQNVTGFLRDSLFVILGRICGRRLCVYFLGGNFDMFYGQRKGVFRWFVRFIIKQIDILIVLAGKIGDQFLPFLESNKIKVVPNCISKIQPWYDKKEIKGASGKCAKVLFVGYLSKAKGALDLVKSICGVKEKFNSDVEFVLCGRPINEEKNITFIDDPHNGYIKMMRIIRDEKMGSYVTVKEDISDQEIFDLMKKSDIFVFPTYSEGFPTVILEAMSFGLPIITTRVGAISEVLSEGTNCLFHTPGDIKTITKHILNLLNNEKTRCSMGRENYNLVNQRYNKHVFSGGIKKVWLRLLN